MTNSNSSNNSTVNNNNTKEVNMKLTVQEVFNELKAQRKNIAIVGVAALNDVFLFSLAGALTGYVGTRISGDSAGDMLIEKVGEVTGFSKFATKLGITATALPFGGQIASAYIVISAIKALFPNTSRDVLRYIINDVSYFFTGKELLPFDLPEEIPAHVMGLDADGFLVWYQHGNNSSKVGTPVHPRHVADGINDPQINPMFKTVAGDNHAKNSNSSTNNNNEVIPYE